jgi:hypothetical protein
MTASADVGRVLHAPFDIAGQASGAVSGLRQLGVCANLYADPHPFGYDAPNFVPPRDRVGQLRLLARVIAAHDTFHFHYGATFSPHFRLNDARLLRAMGKRVVVEFHGSDVRMPSIEETISPFYAPLDGESDGQAERLMRRWAAITDGHAIACNASLAPFLERHFDRVTYAGHRVEVDRFEPRAPDADSSLPLVVVHAPSNPRAKGTAFIQRAAEVVGGIDYRELTGRSHAEVVRALADADLVVDQLCFGSNGVLAIEAMSMAKPVVCYLSDRFAATLPGECPMIRADPVTIAGVLADWLGRRSELHELGLVSRAYAERHHDVRVVAQRLLAAYLALPRT